MRDYREFGGFPGAVLSCVFDGHQGTVVADFAATLFPDLLKAALHRHHTPPVTQTPTPTPPPLASSGPWPLDSGNQDLPSPLTPEWPQCPNGIPVMAAKRERSRSASFPSWALPPNKPPTPHRHTPLHLQFIRRLLRDQQITSHTSCRPSLSAVKDGWTVSELEKSMAEAFQALHRLLLAFGERAKYSGSTGTAVLLIDSFLVSGNVGDSRAILCHGEQPLPLTVDHLAR